MSIVDRIMCLLVILLLLSLHGGLGNTVQISLTSLRDSPSTLLVLLNNTNLLQSLEDLSVDRPRGINVVRWPRSPILLSTVDLSEGADTNRLAEVDVTGYGGGSDVKPVHGLRWELLIVTSLDSVNPTRNGKLSLPLQEGSVGLNELLRINIADGNTSHVG